MHGNETNTINAETEAHLFGSAVAIEAGLTKATFAGNLNMNDDAFSFNKSFNSLLSGKKFNQNQFDNAVQTFKSGSTFNEGKGYDSQPFDNNFKVSIDKLYPLTQ